MKNSPPLIFLRFFRWYCHPKLMNHIEGDLIEEYNLRLRTKGKRKADLKFILDTILLFRPGIIRPVEGPKNINNFGMLQSYFTIGWRNLLRRKGYSLINIGGLALGMTVAMLIGLWIYDELSFDKYHANYDHIAQVWHGGTNPETGAIEGGVALQFPVGAVLRSNYPHYFKRVVMAWWINDFTLAHEETKVSKQGEFIESDVIDMLSLKMLKGTNRSLESPNSIILSQSTAQSIFGDEDPMNKLLKIDNHIDVQVTGVYEDIPRNNKFGEAQFFAPWALWVSANDWLKKNEYNWDNHMVNTYVQLQPDVSAEMANAVIHDLYYKNMPGNFLATVDKYKPFVQVVPMSTWHLYSEFKDGKPDGGRITFVWLFGIIGGFVLLLACINFINLSTARSEKRAKEVGVRKAIGSANSQLVAQFLSESFMVVILAFIVSLALVILLQPVFNQLADKDTKLPFADPVFWMAALGFIMITGFLAGLYPAFYLSSFKPVRVLKGALNTGRQATLPRQILVVIQFTVSVALIIGTVVVYQQVQFARNRPVGFDRDGIITVRLNDEAYAGKHDALKNELLNTGVVSSVSTSSNPLTEIWNTTGGYTWPGKNPNAESEFATCQITHDFGKTIGWKISAGRDLSREFVSDPQEAIVVNEAAVKYMGITDPVGKEFTNLDEYGEQSWTRKIVGVIDDMVMGSPYEPSSPTIFYINEESTYLMHIRIESTVGAAEALPKIEDVFKKVAPSALFRYKFVDEEHERKFNQEERIGRLSGIFSFLAIFISCLGLFGLASFVAEKRTKEIGIRKVMGASEFRLWKMLSKDFVLLVVIACVIAIPVSYFGMNVWLQKYTYHTHVSVWILAASCVSAIAITLLTVSYQSIKASKMNPVLSLRIE